MYAHFMPFLVLSVVTVYRGRYCLIHDEGHNLERCWYLCWKFVDLKVFVKDNNQAYKKSFKIPKG